MKGAKVVANAEVEEALISGDFGRARTRLAVSITPAGGNTSRAKGYTMTLFRKQSDGRWPLARDANLLTPEQQRNGGERIGPRKRPTFADTGQMWVHLVRQVLRAS